MGLFEITAVILVISIASYFLAVKKVSSLSASSKIKPDSLLTYYGRHAAIWAFVQHYTLKEFGFINLYPSMRAQQHDHREAIDSIKQNIQ